MLQWHEFSVTSKEALEGVPAARRSGCQSQDSSGSEEHTSTDSERGGGSEQQPTWLPQESSVCRELDETYASPRSKRCQRCRL